MSIVAGQLVQNQELVCALPEHKLNDALKVMIEYNFSQLPVVDADGKPLGIVTSDSIACTLLHFGAKIEELRVYDALAKLPTHKADEELLDLLDPLLAASAVLVVDPNNGKLVGIITEYDTTQYFRQRAEDIVIVSDIENSLKQHLLTVYDSTEEESPTLQEAIENLSSSWQANRSRGLGALKALQKLYAARDKDEPKKPITNQQLEDIIDKQFPISTDKKTFHDLTLSEFIQLAGKAWAQLDVVFQIGNPMWGRMMEDIRVTRNKLAHFRGETTVVERSRLRFCADWFKNHQPLPKRVEEAAIILPDSVNVPAANDAVDDSTPPKLVESENQDITIDPDSLVTGNLSRHVGNILISTYAKYRPFIDILNAHSSIGPKVTISLKTIENLIKQELPIAAREHTIWWTSSTSPQARSWILAGWRVTQVNLAIGLVSFALWLPTDPAERRVSVATPWELMYWSHEFKAPEYRLLVAIRTVGSIPADVLAFLQNH